jgi:hypothetical protein
MVCHNTVMEQKSPLLRWYQTESCLKNNVVADGLGSDFTLYGAQ